MGGFSKSSCDHSREDEALCHQSASFGFLTRKYQGRNSRSRWPMSLIEGGSSLPTECHSSSALLATLVSADCRKIIADEGILQADSDNPNPSLETHDQYQTFLRNKCFSIKVLSTTSAVDLCNEC
eukprot:562192-Amphidinium_carterae.1